MPTKTRRATKKTTRKKTPATSTTSQAVAHSSKPNYLPWIIAAAAVVAFFYGDQIKARFFDQDKTPNAPAPAPTIPTGFRQAIDGSTTIEAKQRDANRRYLGRLYGQLATYLSADGRLQKPRVDTNQKMASIINSAGSYGAISQSWNPAERYPGTVEILIREFSRLKLEKPGQLTPSNRAAVVDFFNRIAAECK